MVARARRDLFMLQSGTMQRLQQPLSGWFGHARPFEFSDEFIPAENIRRMLSGTTGVLGASALEAGVDVMLEADAAAMQEKRVRLSGLFQELVTELCVDFRFTTGLARRRCG